MNHAMKVEEDDVKVLVARVTNAVEDLAGFHIELAKAELYRDAIVFGRDITPLALGVPVVGVGYGLACMAGAVALTPWLGSAGGFAAMSALHLFVGAIGVAVGRSKLRARRAAPTLEVSPAP